jgi:hypothetical protein
MSVQFLATACSQVLLKSHSGWAAAGAARMLLLLLLLLGAAGTAP